MSIWFRQIGRFNIAPFCTHFGCYCVIIKHAFKLIFGELNRQFGWQIEQKNYIMKYFFLVVWFIKTKIDSVSLYRWTFRFFFVSLVLLYFSQKSRSVLIHKNFQLNIISSNFPVTISIRLNINRDSYSRRSNKRNEE